MPLNWLSNWASTATYDWKSGKWDETGISSNFKRAKGLIHSILRKGLWQLQTQECGLLHFRICWSTFAKIWCVVVASALDR